MFIDYQYQSIDIDWYQFYRLHSWDTGIGGMQPIPWDSNDKEIFAMLDEIILADKEKHLLNSTNMAAVWLYKIINNLLNPLKGPIVYIYLKKSSLNALWHHMGMFLAADSRQSFDKDEISME